MARTTGEATAPRRAPGERRVLLVEDEILIRMDIAHEMTEAGLRVLEAADAAEALALVEAGHEIDLVFSDVQLGEGSCGIDLVRRLRRDRPALPAILTSAARIGPLPDDLGPGWLRFVPKPYQPRQVLALIGRAVEDA